ncbi:MAG TPA: hypothetical protein VGP52_11340 [Stellaceae bacterium]|jgi:hypothetical protein|nr:hypothetical protein [Stellaceae bacterium]
MDADGSPIAPDGPKKARDPDFAFKNIDTSAAECTGNSAANAKPAELAEIGSIDRNVDHLVDRI